MEPTTSTSYEQAREALLEAREIREQLEHILQDFPISYRQRSTEDVRKKVVTATQQGLSLYHQITDRVEQRRAVPR